MMNDGQRRYDSRKQLQLLSLSLSLSLLKPQPASLAANPWGTLKKTREEEGKCQPPLRWRLCLLARV
jgi:hypothetical protein